MVKNLIAKHQQAWNSEFKNLFFSGAVLFLASLLVNYFATNYASERISLPVTDLILSNVRVYDVDGIIIYGALAVAIFVLGILVYHPKKIPFVLKSLALFIVIRAIFISLTHIGPFSPQVIIDPTRLLNFFGLGTSADLFFSGHAGMPFLLALIFWHNKFLRWIFLAVSILFGVMVLLAHLHYSIDVFAAFFITYTIFHLSQEFFPKDWQLLNQ